MHVHETAEAEAVNVAPEVKVRFTNTWPDAENGSGTRDIEVPFTTSDPSEIAPEQSEDGADHKVPEKINSAG